MVLQTPGWLQAVAVVALDKVTVLVVTAQVAAIWELVAALAVAALLLRKKGTVAAQGKADPPFHFGFKSCAMPRPGRQKR